MFEVDTHIKLIRKLKEFIEPNSQSKQETELGLVFLYLHLPFFHSSIKEFGKQACVQS